MRRLLVVVLSCLLVAACRPTILPSPTPAACPSGYDPYVDSRVGVTACYPAGWKVEKGSDTESTSVTFTSPFAEAESVKDIYTITLAVESAEQGFEILSDEELLSATTETLADVQVVVPPRIVEVAGRRAVEYALSREHVVEGQTIEVRCWAAGLAANGPSVFVFVSGSAEHGPKVEALYRSFISTLDLFVPPANATAEPSPSPTPTVAPVSLACPSHYEEHLDVPHGYSMCFPVGWLKDEDLDTERGVFWQFFSSPVTGDTLKDFMRITVGIIPGIQGVPGPSDDEFVRIVAEWVTDNHQQALAEPKAVLISGHKAVEFAYEGKDVFGGELQRLTGWSAWLATSDRMFFIEVAGYSERRVEIERLYREMIPRFVILPIQ